MNGERKKMCPGNLKEYTSVRTTVFRIGVGWAKQSYYKVNKSYSISDNRCTGTVVASRAVKELSSKN